MRHTINRLNGLSFPTTLVGRKLPKSDALNPKSDALNGASKATPEDAGSPTAEASDESHSLKSILPKARFFAGEDIVFESIANNAEECQPGQMVVYRLGIDCPVELIATALARGAAGILTEQVLPSPLPQCIVGDTDRALSEITARQLTSAEGQRPDQRLLTIGVMGGDAKTSTALAIAAVMKDVPCRVAYQTDLGQSDGIIQTANVATTPHVKMGKAVLRELAEAAEAGAAVHIMELDDVSIKAGSYDAIEFDMLVVTGPSQGTCDVTDQDFGPSAIDAALERVSSDGVVIAPAKLTSLIASVTHEECRLITYGVDTDADITLKTVSREHGVLTAVISHHTNSAIVESTLAQGMLAAPLAAATAVGVLTENPLTQISESLSQFRTLPGRIQNVNSPEREFSPNQIESTFDVGGSPRRLEFLLRAFRRQIQMQSPAMLPMQPSKQASTLRAKRLWCVLAVRATDSDETLAQYGRLLERIPDHCVLTCADEDKSSFLRMSHGVLDGVENCAAMRLVADQARAIAWAHESAHAGDCVLVVGGMDRTSQHTQRQSIESIVKNIESAQVGDPIETANTCELKLYQPD